MTFRRLPAELPHAGHHAQPGRSGAGGRINPVRQHQLGLGAGPGRFGAGTLQGFNVGQDGVLIGTYTNGRSRPIGQIAIASFSNPEVSNRPAARRSTRPSTPGS